MTVLQMVLGLICLIFIYLTFVYYRSQVFSKTLAWAWLAWWLFFALLIFWPELVEGLVGQLTPSSPLLAILLAGVLVSGGLSFLVLAKLRGLEKDVEQLTRALTIYRASRRLREK